MGSDIPLSEYPRPSLVRDSYYCLNGKWDIEISKNDIIPSRFTKSITVPYTIETDENINHILQPDEFLFYKKIIIIPEFSTEEKLIIHFGTVDQIAKVYINGELKKEHVGGFLPFEVEVEKWAEQIEIVVVVQDLTDTSFHSRGKQKLDYKQIWYKPQSGIYMPVWVEIVPLNYIKNIKIDTDFDARELKITPYTPVNETLKLAICDKQYEIHSNCENIIKIDDFHPWSPEDPYLYNFSLICGNDKVESYFAFRKIEARNDKNGIKRVFLNNKPIFLSGLLDQGYYEKTMLTPRSDEDYINDIKFAKELGFNFLRKHIKIESDRFYYYCDKLGMLVMQDFVNGGTSYKFFVISAPLFLHNKRDDRTKHNQKMLGRESIEGQQEFIEEAKETVNLLRNHPSIFAWTIFNEAWGQFDSIKLTEIVKNLDSSRLIDTNSGWYDQNVGDFRSNHVYFVKYKLPKKNTIRNRVISLSECGGYNLKIEGHSPDINFGYKSMQDSNQLTKTIENLYENEIIPNISMGLSMVVFTQLSDVETELNGLITYDRKVVKVDRKRIQQINMKCFEALKD